MLSIIVAIAKNNAIGKDNKLIWHLPEDLKDHLMMFLSKLCKKQQSIYVRISKVAH